MKFIMIVIILISIVTYIKIIIENGVLWKKISHEILVEIKHGCCPIIAIENYNRLISMDILPNWMKGANEMLREKIMKRWVEVIINEKDILYISNGTESN